jgi:hypothetical protein
MGHAILRLLVELGNRLNPPQPMVFTTECGYLGRNASPHKSRTSVGEHQA